MFHKTSLTRLEAHPRRAGAVSKGCLVGGGIGAALLLILLAFGGAGCSKYNTLATGRENVQGKWAEIDNQYKRRFDLIPQLVETVKGAANFEKSTLEAVVEARASVGRAQLPSDVPTDPAKLQAYIQAQQSLGGALSRLLVVAEQYPDLKSSQNFLSLQDQLEGTENRIATARRDYIDAVQAFNTSIAVFPSNLIAGMFGFTKVPQLESTPEERAVPKVQFDFGNEKK
jgi:LemA protein